MLFYQPLKHGQPAIIHYKINHGPRNRIIYLLLLYEADVVFERTVDLKTLSDVMLFNCACEIYGG